MKPKIDDRSQPADSSKKLVRLIPFLLFLIFAGFWTATDIMTGLWPAVVPSAIVGVTLVVKGLLSPGHGGRP